MCRVAVGPQQLPCLQDLLRSSLRVACGLDPNECPRVERRRQLPPARPLSTTSCGRPPATTFWVQTRTADLRRQPRRVIDNPRGARASFMASAMTSACARSWTSDRPLRISRPLRSV